MREYLTDYIQHILGGIIMILFMANLPPLS
jgi:hypothetical protein